MKSIVLTLPSFNLHGGIRVILEWANRLARHYQVSLRMLKKDCQCPWFDLNPEIQICEDDRCLVDCDLLIITSPHAAQWLHVGGPKHRVVFLQMMEHLFRPGDAAWERRCRKLYLTSFPLITISQWGIEMLRQLGRRGPTYYVGNGVNLEHFPVITEPKKEMSVLVEGWISTNPTKDPLSYGPKVAEFLKGLGYRILAYSALPLSGDYIHVPDEYYQAPSLETLNCLYERATILIKASQLDFRSCSPMEAMTKGTVTARALESGDDDLVHGVNCLRGPYQLPILKQHALELLSNTPLRERLARACYHHVLDQTWDYWMPQIEKYLCPRN